MIDSEFAQRFALDWLKAWNDHDLDAVLSHYSDEAVLHSPRIRIVTGRNVDSVRGIHELRLYWAQSLDGAGDLFFEVDKVLLGSDALTILYTNHRQQEVAETFVFDGRGKVLESVAAYAS